jgi:hypothetical protein
LGGGRDEDSEHQAAQGGRGGEHSGENGRLVIQERLSGGKQQGMMEQSGFSGKQNRCRFCGGSPGVDE